MRVLKFGGTSLANGQRFEEVAQLVIQSQQQAQSAVVLSAPAKITNLLLTLLDKSLKQQNISFDLQYSYEIFKRILQTLKMLNPMFNLPLMEAKLATEFEQIEGILAAAKAQQAIDEKSYADLSSRGEVLSIAIMAELLKAKGYAISHINPVEVFVAKGERLASSIDLEASSQYFQKLNLPVNNIVLMEGFRAGNEKGEIVLLGRNGSDYSAACLAACLGAEVCEIWTDVDGVYTCDPRLVPDAHLLPNLSYAEAMELSYFGAKVIHPRTVGPLQQNNIPCVIKNTANPKGLGSRIDNVVRAEQSLQVKGITHLDNMAIFNVSGAGMQGQVGMAARIFKAISQTNISVILISQSSSEYSISFCVPMASAPKVQQILKQEFSQELASQLINPISYQENLSIISVVGDGMIKAKGVAANFFCAFHKANISIVAIAQGSSERTISAVVPEKQAIDAVKAIHQALFSHKKIIDVFLVGVGGVGAALIEQINQQQQFLAQKDIALRICGLANSRQMLLNENGIDLSTYQVELSQSQQALDFEQLFAFKEQYHLVNPVLVDCTSSEEVAGCYAKALDAGFNVVTPNKKANTREMAYYQLLRAKERSNQRKFLYDTNVGAGLPVIENLQNLLAAGDKLLHFSGILSGSLSFIFGQLDEGLSLSEATILAKQKGFTEPDPRDDLGGQDVARKLLILARESGLNLELSDIVVDSVLPQGFAEGLSTAEFLQLLPSLDEAFKQKVQQAKSEGKVLRYVGQIENNQCRVSIVAVDEQDPLYKVKDGENALAFYTKFYQPIPLLLRGYGAGNAVTAAGVFADILRAVQQ